MSKFFEDEFLLEVVKSYWLAKCVYVNVTSELAIKLKSKSQALREFHFTSIFFSLSFSKYGYFLVFIKALSAIIL